MPFWCVLRNDMIYSHQKHLLEVGSESVVNGHTYFKRIPMWGIMRYWTMSPVFPLLITKLFLVETYIIQFRIRSVTSALYLSYRGRQVDFDKSLLS